MRAECRSLHGSARQGPHLCTTGSVALRGVIMVSFLRALCLAAHGLMCGSNPHSSSPPSAVTAADTVHAAMDEQAGIPGTATGVFRTSKSGQPTAWFSLLPQPYTQPSLVSASVCLTPHATAVTHGGCVWGNGNVTGVGGWHSSRFASSWMLSGLRSEKASMDAVVRNGSLWLCALARRALSSGGAPSVVACGLGAAGAVPLVGAPMPRRPWRLLPQVHSWPWEVTAALCCRPAGTSASGG